MVGLYLAAWLGVMREGASQIQLLPCGLVSSYTAPPAAGQICRFSLHDVGQSCSFSPHTAGLVAEGEGRMLFAPLREAWLAGEA